MKKVIIAVLAASCAIPAVAGDVYVSASLGASAVNFDASGTSLSANATALALVAGYQFNRGFGVEVGSAHFGKVDLHSGAAIVNSDNLVSLYAAVTGTWPATESLSVYAKGGVVRTDSAVPLNNTANATQIHYSALLGLGLGYALTPKVTAFAEYQNFGKTVDAPGFTMKASTLSAGVRYAF
jgi:OOP family OmpA-OmpF porin